MNTFLGIADQWGRLLWSQSWQIAIFVGLIGVVSLLSRRASANFRYWLWCIVLVRLCFPMNVALPLGMGGEVRQAAETYVQTALVRPEIVPLTNPVGTVQSVQDTSLRARQSASGIAHVQAGYGAMSFNAKLMIAWGLLSASIASLILLRSFQTYRLLRKCPPINRPELLVLIDQLRVRYGIRRPLQTVCFSPSLAGRGPAVVGILRPAIILPPKMVEQWTLDEIEPVLLHELAHIKRGDLFINLIQMIVQAIYFFHPLVWYANAQIRRERELVCDDLAVLHSDGRRKRYSQSIMRVIEEIGKDEPMLGAVGMGMAESRSSLAKRIVRLMRQNYKLYKPVGWFSVAVLILLAAVGVALAGERPATVSEIPQLLPVKVTPQWVEDFESSASGVGTWPSGWIADGNASHHDVCYVDGDTFKDTHGNTLRLHGDTPVWSPLAHRKIDLAVPFQIAFDIYLESETSDCTCVVGMRGQPSWAAAGVLLFDTSPSGEVKGLESVADGGVVSRGQATGQLHIERGKWCRVQLTLQEIKGLQSLSITLDDGATVQGPVQLSSDAALLKDMRYLQLEVRSGTAWFDNVSVAQFSAVGVALAGERPAGVSDTQKLGEEVSKRVNNFTDSQTFTLKDGETVRMDVKENEAQVSAINITPYIVEEGTRFDIELLNMNGNPTQNGTEHISVIHDGKSDGLNTGLLVGGKPMMCKVRFTPERKGGSVVFEAKVLFTKMLTPEETEAMLATQGKAGQIKLDFMKFSRAIMQHKQQEGHLPESLEPLSQTLPKDIYSTDGADYHYEILGKGYILSSCGKDGVYGNDDDFILVSGSRSSQSGLRNEIYPLRQDENPALQDAGSTVQREYTNPPGRRPKGNASLSGKIVDAATGEPIDHGTLFLHCLASLDAIFIDVPSDGTFKFENIPNGQYNLSAIHVAGYVDSRYNPENKEGKFPPFQLKDNEQRTDVVLTMQRARSIRGRVSTGDGGAFPRDGGMTVVAWAEKKDTGPDGTRYEIAAQMNVNQEDGTYFLNGLDERPVYVMAMDFRAQERDSPYPPMYFPGTFSRNEATRITFDKEDVIKNVDIRLRKTGGLPMEGTVTDRVTGKPIPKALVVIHHKDMLFDRATAYTDDQGHYRFECLSPGEMQVHVDATPSVFVRTRKPVTLMTSTTIMQMDFTLMTGATLSGKFVDEEGKPWQTHKPYGSASVVDLAEKQSGGYSGVPSRYASGGPIQIVTYSFGEGDYGETDMAFLNDNSFVINGMMPGKVRISFNPYAEGQGVTKILHGGKDIGISGNIEVGSGQTIDDISIVIGPDKKP